MFSSLRYNKNKRSILQSCSAYIYNWAESSFEPYIAVIFRHISRYLDINKNFIAALKDSDSDYRIIVFKIIALVTLDMIAPNSFTGQINIGIKNIHKKSMDELLYPGYISQQEYDEDKITMQSICEERIPQIYKELLSYRNRNN